MTERVAVYVDGFNLYYGLRSKKWKRYYWLDLRRMSENLMKPGQRLVIVRYFTARVFPEVGDTSNTKRQTTYWEALSTLQDLQFHYGYYMVKDRYCASCGVNGRTYEEKMTDVNIAVELLDDAQTNKFDTALVISADGDMSGLVRKVRERFPNKRVVVAFPPGRHSANLRNAATAYLSIGRDLLRDSQLSERVTKADGYVLERPMEWA